MTRTLCNKELFSISDSLVWPYDVPAWNKFQLVKCIKWGIYSVQLLAENKLTFTTLACFDSDGFYPTIYSLELRCDEIEAIVQMAFCRHLLQVGVAVYILVCKVVRHQKSCREITARWNGC